MPPLLSRASIPAEQEALLWCLRVDRTKPPNPLLSRDLDWSLLGRAAASHGVLPLVVRSLPQTGTTCPSPLLKEWQTQMRLLRLDNLRRCAELVTLQRDLEAGGIAFLALKGPVLAAAWYGDVGLRAFTDLDILVQPADAEGATEVLKRQGYRPALPLQPRWERQHLRSFGEMTFVRAEPPGAVDLHCRLLPNDYSFAASPPDLWDRPKRVTIGSASIPTPDAENTLVFLALHAAKHDWSSLRWLCDIAQLLIEEGDLDWDRIDKRIRDLRCGRLVQIGFFLAQWLLGAPLPARQLPPGGRRRRLEAFAHQIVRTRLLTAPGKKCEQPVLPWDSLFFQAMQQPLDRWRLIYSTFFRPSPLELQMLPLPLWIEPLYAVIRPLRLMAKYGRAWLTGKAGGP